MKTANSPLVDSPSTDAIMRAVNAQQTRPTMALLFHTRENGQKLSVVTAHGIAPDNKKRVSIQPGRPLTSEDEAQILGLLRPGSASDTFRVYPPGLLHATSSYSMWSLPPERYPMALLGNASAQPVHRDVIWPNLVLLAMQRRLYVVAIPGNERPTADTECFAAPLANCWVNSEVCTGSAPLPETTGIDDIPGWNRVLRDSAFSHANAPDVIRSAAKKNRKSIDPMDYWRSASPEPFPDASLVPLRFRLRDWIDYTQAVERR